jgi:hypothetical protein
MLQQMFLKQHRLNAALAPQDREQKLQRIAERAWVQSAGAECRADRLKQIEDNKPDGRCDYTVKAEPMSYTYPQVAKALRPWMHTWKSMDEDHWREHEDSEGNFGADADMQLRDWHNWEPSIQTLVTPDGIIAVANVPAQARMKWSPDAKVIALDTFDRIAKGFTADPSKALTPAVQQLKLSHPAVFNSAHVLSRGALAHWVKHGIEDRRAQCMCAPPITTPGLRRALMPRLRAGILWIRLNKYTYTPVIAYDGTLVAQQLVFQGESMACAPSEFFRRQSAEVLNGFLFNYSSDHWVTRATVCQLLKAIEAYRVRKCTH